MLCEKFELRMQMLLDARRHPEFDDELQSHASQCAECRRDLAAQEKLFAGLELFDPPALSPDFSQRVIADLQVSRPSTWSRVGRLGAIAVAASLLVALVPAIRNRLSHRAAPEKSASVARSPRSAPSTLAITQLPRKNHGEPVAQHDSPAPAAVANAASVPPNPSADTKPDAFPAANMNSDPLVFLEELRASLSAVSGDPLESLDKIAEGIRPLASSLQTTFNALLRSLPVGNDQRAPKASPDTSRVVDRDWIA